MTKPTSTQILFTSYGLLIAYIYGMGWLLWNYPLVAVGVLVACSLGCLGLVAWKG